MTERIKPKPDPDIAEFRLSFSSASPIREVVLAQRALMGNMLIRGENYGGRNQALVALCASAAMSDQGVIYITEGLAPTLSAVLRNTAREAFGPTRFHALNIAVEKGGKFKVSRKAISVMQFNPNYAPSSVDEVRRRLPGILDWITSSDYEVPLLLVLENYHLYCKEFAANLLVDANAANCAVILTTLGADPRMGTSPEIDLGVFEKCAIVLDLNRRRLGDVP